MTTTENKVVKTRDAATSVLRKLGVKARDYNLFIVKDKKSGEFKINIILAAKHLKDLNDQMMKETKVSDDTRTIGGKTIGKTLARNPMLMDALNDKWNGKKVGKKEKALLEKKEQDLLDAAKAPKVKPRSVTSVAKEMVLAGCTNKEIWLVIKEEFSLSDSKKYYPAWYRHTMRKSGVIDK